MSESRGTPSEADRTWLEYVGRRPKLAEWRSYKMMGAKTELAEEGKSGESIIDRLRENEPYYAFMHDQVVGGDDRKRFLDMNDDEALLYAVVGEYGATYGMDDIVLHTWPRVPFNDAEEFLNNGRKTLNRDLYFQILCAKAMNISIDSDEVMKVSLDIERFFLNVKNNLIFFQGWNNLDVFIETRCRYPHVSIFDRMTQPLGHEDEVRTIDHDYLYKVLMAPKPDPAEIPEDRWHDMSVRLVDIAKDQIRTAKTRGVFGHRETAFMLIMNNALSCFLGDVEEVAFLETVSAFINEVEIRRRYWEVYAKGSKQIRYDLLDPRIFDYLREYGPAFASPLFQKVLDSATTLEQTSDGLIRFVNRPNESPS